MDPLATSHFSNRHLLRDFDARVARNHLELATLLTRIAEIDERRLYLEEGYPSMKAFLVRRMRLPTENAAYKRLTAARLAQKYPGILVALYDGRLHLRGVLTLAPHLTPTNADELVAAALDKTCFELEVMLAQRFPRPDMPERLDALAAPPSSPDSLAPGRVEATIPDRIAHGHAESRPRRFGATDRPAPSRGSADPRHIPAAVKRVVAERDREQCSFVSDSGKRCEERRLLEFDHEVPVARGGEATVENIRLRCRAHNQHAAERTFGAEFMERKREAARRAPTSARPASS